MTYDLLIIILPLLNMLGNKMTIELYRNIILYQTLFETKQN